MQLTHIEALVSAPLQRFRQAYQEALASEETLLDQVAQGLAAHRGKQLRPLLLLLCHAASQATYEGEERLAVAVEMLHASSLLHDDVVDESPLRRGAPTASSLYGNKAAVLCGDYFLAKVMWELNAFNNMEASHIVEHAVMEMSVGELLQLARSASQDVSVEHYFDTICRKTASLIAACCELGALGTPHQAALREYGRHFGNAFQLRDDLLDYLPSTLTGKPTGNDLKEGKVTLPLIHYLRLAPHEDAALVRQNMLASPADTRAVEQAARMIGRSEAVALTRKAIHQETIKARNCLNGLDEGPHKEGLMALAQFLEDKEH